LFENLGDGRFREIGAAAGVRTWINSNAACWIDYDRDGLLDLFVTGYFDERVDLWDLADTRIMQSSFEFAENGGTNRLYRNLGGLRFEEVGQAAGLQGTRWTMAAAAADFDGDGWVDLYLANDYGPEEFLRNDGDGGFTARGDVGLTESSKSGMCVAVGDFENSGELGVFVTNISRRGFLFQGNNLRQNRLDDARRPRFVNLSDSASSVMREVTDCGWAWGAQFGDLDNDGRADLFVANGFISASRDSEYWYDMAKVAGGAGDLFQDARNWPPIGEKSLSGYEQSRVLWNRGRQRFTEVGKAVGLADTFDGRAVAMADLAGRGALDVVVANQGGPLLIYRSEPAGDPGWIQLRLRGTRSNRDAVGARVEVALDDGSRQAQVVLAGSGFSAQNDLTLHFGLGEGRAVRDVSVVWPSGARQSFGALGGRARHVLEEALP
ncbi:MAG TPA: CRTAC1 family protein, partial [Planctomycetota bacterium]|nr:CRTAC1 family protein [Planctomycetota bacterium]